MKKNYLLLKFGIAFCLGLIFSPDSANAQLYPFTEHTFTNAGAEGKDGPTLLECQAAYVGEAWALDPSFFNMSTQGIQEWTVPSDGDYRIEVAGAQGGLHAYTVDPEEGGLGAVMTGTFSLVEGQVLHILVGQKGEPSRSGGGFEEDNAAPGGGGGSFVWDPTDESMPLMAAGGGGAGASPGGYAGKNATTGLNGQNTQGLSNGGLDGNGGRNNNGVCSWWCGAGAGWITNGTGGNQATLYNYIGGGSGAQGGRRALDGGFGGVRWNDGTDSGGDGGFGGGGGGGSDNTNGGGGGGYSGGGGGRGCEVNPGGGGSYNGGIDQVNEVSNVGHGYVRIELLCTPLTTSVSGYEFCEGELLTMTASSETGGTVTWDGGVVDGVAFAPPVGTTTYTATSDGPDDCNFSATILVNEYPTIIAGVSDATICLGDAVVFAGAGAETYTWDMGVIDGVPFTPGDIGTVTYTVTGYDEIGCDGTATVDVTVDPVPVVEASASETELCEGETLIFTISGDADTYEWDPADIVTGVPYMPEDGVETFTLTGYYDATGCSTEDVVTITLNPTPFVTASADDGIFCADEPIVLAAGGDADIYNWSPTDLTPGIGTHTYTVTGIYDGIEGCPATATVEVNVVGLPIVNASADNEAICLGQSVTLSGDGASFYEWDPDYVVNGEPFIPESTGIFDFTVTGEDSFGCTSEATITITVAEPMTLTYDVTMPIVGDDGEIDLIITGGVPPFTFDWDNDGTGDFDDDEDLTGIGSGAYHVTVVGASGCTEDLLLYVRSQLGIDDNETNVSIYPNPTTDIINIEVEGQFNYVLTDISGAVVQSGFGNTIQAISLEDYADGTYFLSITKDGLPTTLKVVKQ